jgi:hypothetical protein
MKFFWEREKKGYLKVAPEADPTALVQMKGGSPYHVDPDVATLRRYIRKKETDIEDYETEVRTIAIMNSKNRVSSKVKAGGLCLVMLASAFCLIYFSILLQESSGQQLSSQ